MRMATRVFSGSCANILGYRDLGSAAASVNVALVWSTAGKADERRATSADSRCFIVGPQAIANAIRSANGCRALRLPIAFTEVKAGSREN